VGQLRASVSDRNKAFDEQTAREMFLFLIQPVLRWIRTRHLVIIPHEHLNYIPFQIFQDPSDNRYVGERYQVTYAPSATVLMGLKKEKNIAKGKLLAAADPNILEAQDEVEAIARLYPGRSSVFADRLIKEADLKARAGDYSLLHLSVHGEFSPREPLLSHLKLRKGGADDGKLTAAEMFGLPLEGARLVTLSACETGQAEATHANEILGMVRALLFAGADTLVLSSWKVDAASTALWMETFYREAQKKPLSEAARLAVATVKKQYPDPYFWGPFLMIGR
jgi:CHAT domain-containing protein